MAGKGPYFVTLEGGEGSGKTTQIKLLADALKNDGIDNIAVRDPGGTPGSEEIRALLVTGDPDRWDKITEVLLYSAARRELLVRKIIPALDAGQWVVSDRFVGSTYAYQGYGHGAPMDILKQISVAVVGDRMPDLTLILDIDPELGLHRALHGKNRATEEIRFEKLELDFHKRLRQGYLDMAKDDPQRYVVLNADQSVDDLHALIMKTIRDRLTT